MKKILRPIIFILILIFLIYNVFNVLWLEKNSLSYFYEEPKNSLDVVYIGSSQAYDYFNTVLAYDKYGFTTGIMGSGWQPFPTIKYLLKESQKYQKPELYVIDIKQIVNDYNTISDEEIRTTVDAMKFSKNRKNAIDELLNYRGESKEHFSEYYYSFFIYHNKWKNVSNVNFEGDKHLYKGYNLTETTANTEPQAQYEWNENIVDLPDENKADLTNLITYIKENNINAVFVIAKRTFTDEEMMRLNDAISIINENGLKVLNFKNIEEFEVDWDKDFCDFEHLNMYGATKYTLYFSKYLKENYDLPDHSNDPLYSSWDDEYKRFKEDFENLTGRNYDELLLEYNKMY